MRNDVKLGFAIGGVLLAVLIVYVLVVPGGSNIKQAKLDSKAEKSEGGKVTLETVPATQASVPPPAPAGVFTPGASTAEPSKPPTEVASNVTDDKAVAQAVDPAPPAKSKDIDWNKLLNGQALMTETPMVQSGAVHSLPKSALPDAQVSPPPLEPESPPKYASTNAPAISPAAGNSVSNQTPMDQPDRPAVHVTGRGSDALAVPSTRPSGAVAGRTHVVQANETLSSISAAAYGSSNYWPAIVKANPNLDPNRMKVGATVVLPDLKSVKPGEPQTASAKVAGTSSASATIDPHKQYRVVAGDSMYRISVKLYGNASMAGKIYDANKQAIGDDPAKLKLNQVLSLPQPPTVAAVH